MSNELGRGSSKAAKFSIKVIVSTSFTIGFVLFLFFLALRGNLAYLFTTSEEVVKAVADLSPLLALSILLNSVQPVLSGKFIVLFVKFSIEHVGNHCIIHVVDNGLTNKLTIINKQELLSELDGRVLWHTLT